MKYWCVSVCVFLCLLVYTILSTLIMNYPELLYIISKKIWIWNCQYRFYKLSMLIVNQYDIPLDEIQKSNPCGRKRDNMTVYFYEKDGKDIPIN